MLKRAVLVLWLASAACLGASFAQSAGDLQSWGASIAQLACPDLALGGADIVVEPEATVWAYGVRAASVRVTSLEGGGRPLLLARFGIADGKLTFLAVRGSACMGAASPTAVETRIGVAVARLSVLAGAASFQDPGAGGESRRLIFSFDAASDVRGGKTCPAYFSPRTGSIVLFGSIPRVAN